MVSEVVEHLECWDEQRYDVVLSDLLSALDHKLPRVVIGTPSLLTPERPVLIEVSTETRILETL
jgi:hypothetical protein